MQIYRADVRDLAACAALDASYDTDHVWQVTQQEEDNEVLTRLRAVRLPRTMRVPYPAWGEGLTLHQERGNLILIAAETPEVRGCLDQECQPDQGIAWIHHLVVAPPHRRRGTGSGLLTRAMQQARQLNMAQAMAVVQSKNYPAICFLQRHGFTFCGYNERYYRNQDIALYFVCGL